MDNHSNNTRRSLNARRNAAGKEAPDDRVTRRKRYVGQGSQNNAHRSQIYHPSNEERKLQHWKGIACVFIVLALLLTIGVGVLLSKGYGRECCLYF